MIKCINPHKFLIDDQSKLRICIFNFVFVLKSILRYWTFYFLRKLFFIAWKLFVVQINFGFCKGDDNFGGVQRKELDDFTKSLGKQMTLVMYRMQVQYSAVQCSTYSSVQYSTVQCRLLP